MVTFMMTVVPFLYWPLQWLWACDGSMWIHSDPTAHRQWKGKDDVLNILLQNTIFYIFIIHKYISNINKESVGKDLSLTFTYADINFGLV